MTSRELDEYRALRDTIRERGTARHWIVVVGLAAWAGLCLAALLLAAPPVCTLVSLLLLVVTFEVVFALHTGVERVGRYIQVFYESPSDSAAWEQVAMAYGQAFGGGGLDALFSPLFWAAALFNALPLLLAGPVAIEWVLVGAVHLLFAVRVWTARRQAGRQRAIDLVRFEQLKQQRAH
jgi:hypothetical protein